MSDSLIVKNWSSVHQVEISEEAIRHIFQPSRNYRISCQSYPAGTSLPVISRAGFCFLLSGECHLKFNDEVRLTAGEYVEFPAGHHKLTVIGNQEVMLVKVWLLPEEVRPE